MRYVLSLYALNVLLYSQTLSSAAPAICSGPDVDLGYQLHRGNLDPTGNYYNFSTIRYAAPPTGQNRFRAPQPPARNKNIIHNGKQGRMCPQANPGWFFIVEQWIDTYKPGTPVNVTKQQVAELAAFPASELPHLNPGDGRVTEDCLFLDVLVPKDSFRSNRTRENTDRSTASTTSTSRGLPVIAWIYGGGYTSGDKTDYSAGTSPVGLLKASEANDGKAAIFVGINYRLGAFGWLAGSEVVSDGDPNAGLLDQRFAFEWIRKYIALFGGDPSRVTVMGESAGAGSIMHHITSYGGNGPPLPFHKAILQSPAFSPVSLDQNEIYDSLLQYAGVDNLASLRRVSFETLLQANALQVARSHYGSYTYSPVVDGSYVLAPPGALLAAGRFNKDLDVLVANNADEGLLFTNPSVQTNNAFDELIVALAPSFSPKDIDTVTAQLYPPDFSGKYGYVDEITRQACMLAELVITCNNVYLSNAFDNRTHAYLFAVPPALHAQDIAYTYYNGVNQIQGSVGAQTIAPKVAHAMQEILTTFAATGKPTYSKGEVVVPWGSRANMLTLNTTGFSTAPDSAANSRCLFWQSKLTELSSKSSSSEKSLES